MATDKDLPNKVSFSGKSDDAILILEDDYALATEITDNDALDNSHKVNDIRVDLDEQELQHLIGLILQQDQSAFVKLFHLMSTRVHSLALRITMNTQLAEEVTEDTFYQIWRQAPRFDPARGTVIAWIMTIARSRALDSLRKNLAFSQHDTLDTTTDVNQQIPDSQDLLSAIQQNQCLHTALTGLDALPRQLIALAFFRGMSHEEIANHTGLALGTVKSHLRKAILQLKTALS